MSPLTLKVLKPNGELQQSWPAELLGQFSQWLVTLSDANTLTRRPVADLDYTIEHSSLGIFSTVDYYHSFIHFHADGRFKMLYINLATPATRHGSELTWTDLGLDIIRLPHQFAKITNQAEFNAAKRHLSADLAHTAETTAHQLLEQIGYGAFPFLVNDYAKTLADITTELGTTAKMRYTEGQS